MQTVIVSHVEVQGLPRNILFLINRELDGYDIVVESTQTTADVHMLAERLADKKKPFKSAKAKEAIDRGYTMALRKDIEEIIFTL